MRIGTWNCRLNIDDKRAALESLHLDVAVVPESAQHPAIAHQVGVSHAWTGQNPKKGLGVFAFSPWSIDPIREADPMPWCLPVNVRHVDGPEFTLLAVWTVKRANDERPAYAAQLGSVIERWGDSLEKHPTVIAGDFNASFQGPSRGPHHRNMERLATLGAHSAFHLVHGQVAPEDEPATLRWIGPGRKPYTYHCDYLVVSRPLIDGVRGVEVGSLIDWVDSGLSDHCPVVVDLDDSILRYSN